MRLHTDKLDRFDVAQAIVASHSTNPEGRGYMADVIEPHGSRTRDHAFEVALVGYGDRHTRARAWGQPIYGKGEQWEAPRAATYDDWGYFIAEVFALDPDAVFGPYKGIEDFHAQTRYKFDDRPDEGPFTVVAAGTYHGTTDTLVLDAFAGGGVR